MAGESAREVARRQREKAERLTRSAELYERGAEGEQLTAAALSQLPAGTWTVFHDLRWPGRRFANVDHVAVGPPGIFVIDSKNWSGSITVQNNVLRQNGRSRETAVAGAAEAAIAVGQLTRAVPITHVVPVLCFVRDEQLTGWSRDVVVCSTATLVSYLLTRPAELTAEQVGLASLELDAAFRSATAPPTSRSTTQRRGAAPAPRPRSHAGRASGRSRAGRSSTRADLLKLLVAGMVAFLLLSRPELFVSLVGWIAPAVSLLIGGTA